MFLSGPSLHDTTLENVSYEKGELLLAFELSGKSFQLRFPRERKAMLWARGFVFPIIVHTPEIVAIGALEEPLASIWNETERYVAGGTEWFLSLDPLMGGPDVGVAFCGDPTTLRVEIKSV